MCGYKREPTWLVAVGGERPSAELYLTPQLTPWLSPPLSLPPPFAALSCSPPPRFLHRRRDFFTAAAISSSPPRVLHRRRESLIAAASSSSPPRFLDRRRREPLIAAVEGRWEMKVIEKIRLAEKEGRVLFSLEYFPPKTEEGVENLLDRIERMAAYNPAFCDMTWGAGGSTADLTLEIACRMQNAVCVETMMHLTCTNMPVDKIDHALHAVRSNGIHNVLALRGDPPHGQDAFVKMDGGFACALDLVRHIRERHKDFFGITVAGYPEAHHDVFQDDGFATEDDYRRDLVYLKSKVDAGADVIVTQLFYDTDIFFKFVNDCREIGITCPIVPGIMPIYNYKGFLRMTTFCKTKIPNEVREALEGIKENEEAVREYGVHLGTEMCKRILAHGIKTLHLYTLNIETSALAILTNLGLIQHNKLPRTLPWRPPTNTFRVHEDVRPIFWGNRPKSYISRTQGWENYPQGRWGDSRNPSYGALSDHQFSRPRSHDKRIKKEWAVPLTSVLDVHERFVKHCLGELKSSPWSELEGLRPETSIIRDRLAAVNSKGFLTINSQPAVNGQESDSPCVGWGGPGGLVYQKAYLEFFCSEEKLGVVEAAGGAHPSLTYMAVNGRGEWRSSKGAGVNAVTWGVFPGREVLQPTVVDPTSFGVWKDEAFALWSRGWAALYPDGDPSRLVLKEVESSYYLVSLVDNDYVRGGDLCGLLDGI